jgi:hypothetical protein
MKNWLTLELPIINYDYESDSIDFEGVLSFSLVWISSEPERTIRVVLDWAWIKISFGRQMLDLEVIEGRYWDDMVNLPYLSLVLPC